MARGVEPGSWRRAAAWVLVVGGVIAGHGWVTQELAALRERWATEPPPIARMEVAFVRELRPSAPPPVAAAGAVPRRAPAPQAARAAAPEPAAPEPAASAPEVRKPPEPAEAQPERPPVEPPEEHLLVEPPEEHLPVEPPEEHLPVEPPEEHLPVKPPEEHLPVKPPEEHLPVAPPAAASGVEPASRADPVARAQAGTADDTTASRDVAETLGGPPRDGTAQPFAWPPSTRVSYAMTGYYRGDVQGTAQVQWVRSGPRYQVHLDVDAALLFSRRMTSDGELTDAGLVPRRYDEETRIGWLRPQRMAMFFDDDEIVLADGRVHPAWPGVQDTASQFVQLTWLFTTRPHLLSVGNTIELPLALPGRVKRVTLDVVAQERLWTPVGELDTFHLKPRPDARPSDDLSAQMWFAPSLRYLPVRIRIQRDAETYIDLLMRRLPLQAER